MPVEPRATYRVQLNPGFTLDAAARLAPYLNRLGVSHLYCSPYLQAAPGSTHGYDVVNPLRVNRELGGEEAHRRLTASLAEQGLGQVLDIVPNHMTISSPKDNPWWWDVLENGPSSACAAYFDVDWDPPEARHSNEVLVPVLGDHYGRVLEAGEIRLDYELGKFSVCYYDNRYPVDPRSLSGLLERAARASGSERLAFIASAFAGLPAPPAGDVQAARRRSRDKEVLYRLLVELVEDQPEVEHAVRSVVNQLNQDVDALDFFLELQNYRLAYWRMAERELGYRRFFDINTLIGLRMENEQVYTHTHRRIVEWLKQGVLDGLRIDHPDGLRDPLGYFERLSAERPEAWIVVEKILEEDEPLPENWPVAGTTGYDFLNRINGVQVDPAAEQVLSEFYARFTGRTTNYAALVRRKKLQVMEDVLRSDVNRLTALLVRVTERRRLYRDYARSELREALCETAACLPVYRTYLRPDDPAPSPQDEAVLNETMARAAANRTDLDPRLFELFGELLRLRFSGEPELEFVMRFQQFTGPVMAKGVEDTAFYNYNRFISLNEVGGSPGCFGRSVEEFHRAAQETQRKWPLTMLATSTHDTKRSEDMRARLNVLSELPERWIEAVEHWAELNQPYRSSGRPDPNDEYLFYQTLVGAWPISEERMLAYMEKASREAKTHTSWTDPNPEYESALAAFVRGALQNQAFLGELERFAASIDKAGQVNSLAQTLVKLASPGVPDLYQGTELWDFSLVDPDNRRPVDFEQRMRLLDDLEAGLTPEQVLARAAVGLPKLWVIRQALDLRRRRPELFGAEAFYQPIPVQEGTALAFIRGGSRGGEARAGAVVVVPRFPLRWQAEPPDATLHLPPGPWRSLLSGENLPGGEVNVESLLKRFPVCLLEREAEDE